MLEMFDPPILLNRDALPELPISITNRREATAIFTRPSEANKANEFRAGEARHFLPSFDRISSG